MSGHSKWAGISTRKRLSMPNGAISSGSLRGPSRSPAREGGGDPDHNAALAQAIIKAKDANMPHDNIDRAIKKGSGAGADAETYLQPHLRGIRSRRRRGVRHGAHR